MEETSLGSESEIDAPKTVDDESAANYVEINVEDSVDIQPHRKVDDDLSWLPNTVSVCDLKLTYDGQRVTFGNLFIVGTAHFSVKSQEDVRTVIRKISPDAVMVELCNERASLLTTDEEEVMADVENRSTLEIVKMMVQKHGKSSGIFQAALLLAYTDITRKLGMPPGGEFKAAFEETRKLSHCKFILGDRPIGLTIRRILASMSAWTKVKLIFQLCSTFLHKVTEEDVERMKEGDMLDQLVREFGGEFPTIAKVLLHERDEFMSFMCVKIAKELLHHRLQQDLDQAPAINIVAVVGIGHVKGIVQNFQNEINVRELMTVPPARPPSLRVKAVKWAAFGVLLYGSYRLAKGVRNLFR